MAKTLECSLGKINLLDNNPRTIRDAAFNRLVESVERDPDFMMARGIVVWQVPTKLEVSSEFGASNGNNVFSGQLGKLVVLGGNQRCKAFMALGRTKLEDDWIIEAKHKDGSWWTPEEAERFILLDNDQPGMSGENDMQKMVDHFSELSMELAGIDFSEFQAKLGIVPETEKDVMDEAEEDDELGEKSEELQDFIHERERTRMNLKAIDENGFYLVVDFESLDNKAEFLQKAGLTGKNGRVAIDQGSYVVFVFESYDQKMEFAQKAGLLDEDDDEFGGLVFERFCDGRWFAKKFGIELKESGLHFRPRKVEQTLAEMARDDKKQKTVRQLENEIYEKLRKEREELGMEVSSTKKRASKQENDGLPLPGRVYGPKDEDDELVDETSK